MYYLKKNVEPKPYIDPSSNLEYMHQVLRTLVGTSVHALRNSYVHYSFLTLLIAYSYHNRATRAIVSPKWSRASRVICFWRHRTRI